MVNLESAEIVFFVFFKIVINNSLKNRRPNSNFSYFFYCMHCKKIENFYNTYNLKLFCIKRGTCIKIKTLDGALCIIMHNLQKTLYIPNHAYTKTYKFIKTFYTIFHI